jgi:PAS domain S-box-containing protein
LTDRGIEVVTVIDKPTYEELEQRVRELETAESKCKQALESSMEQERRTRSLFDGIPVGLYRTAEDGRILDANPALAEMLGFPDPQSLVFLNSAQFLVHPEEQIKQRNILKQEGVLHGYEVEFRRRDGSTLWGRDSARVFSGPDGKSYYEGSLEDITERKRSEVVLGESEERFRVAKEASLDSFLTFRAERDGQGRIVDFIFTDMNANAEHMLQMSREHLLGKRMCVELPINRVNGFFEKYRQVAETGVPLEEEFHLPDTHVPAAWHYHQVVKLGDGIAILHRDVTERRKAEEALRESEENHRRLFETMAQGVIYQAADGSIISANPAAQRILGLPFDRMCGKTSLDPRWKMIREDGSAVPGEDHPAMVALRTGQTIGPVIRGVFHPDRDTHIWLSITAIPLFRPGETEPFQAYATFEDITRRKWPIKRRGTTASGMKRSSRSGRRTGAV